MNFRVQLFDKRCFNINFLHTMYLVYVVKITNIVDPCLDSLANNFFDTSAVMDKPKPPRELCETLPPKEIKKRFGTRDPSKKKPLKNL